MTERHDVYYAYRRVSAGIWQDPSDIMEASKALYRLEDVECIEKRMLNITTREIDKATRQVYAELGSNHNSVPPIQCDPTVQTPSTIGEQTLFTSTENQDEIHGSIALETLPKGEKPGNGKLKGTMDAKTLLQSYNKAALTNTRAYKVPLRKRQTRGY